MELLFDYALRVAPGLLLIASTYLLLPRRSAGARIALLIAGFILARDAMTPLGFWRLGKAANTPWLRFAEDGALLWTLGFVSLALTAAVLRFNPALRPYVKWFGPNKAASIGAGAAGAAIVLLPALLSYPFIPVAQRGGAVPGELLPALFFMAMAGNWMEEALFRGYLQGWLERSTEPWRAALLSGLVFAAGHIYLAATVTDMGLVVILFTLYEGLACSFIRMKHGHVASTITHGLAIFGLASGLL